MASVFLSYSREDAAKAKPLAEALEHAGHQVWWDRHIRSGSEFAGAIEEALKRSDVVLVLWSSASVQSGWVRDEAAEGRDSGRLVPVVIDDSRPPIGFRQVQALDLSGWSGRGAPKQLNELLSAIEEKAPSGAGAEEPRRDRHEQTTSFANPRFRLAAAAFGVLAVVLLLLGAWLYSGKGDTAAETPTIAVLPFADLSPAGDKAYFAEGVAEAILSMLAREPGINVIGRTSSWQFKDRSADLKDIRRALGVTHVLEGSARTSGDQLRMSVRLLDASNGRQIWAEDYERRMRNIFAVQDEIGRAVAERLSGSLSKQGRRAEGQVTQVDTYTLYLAARAKMRERKERSLREALQLSKQVIEADPTFAPGHAIYAELIWLLSSENYGDIPVERARQLARPHALRAIKLAPDAAEGYAALGPISPPKAAVEPLKRAINLDPSRGELRVWLAVVYSKLGLNEEAMQQFRAVAQMEPLWGPSIAHYAHSLAGSGRLSEALALVDGFESRGGSRAYAAGVRSDLALGTGDLSEAVRYARLALSIDPDTPFVRVKLSSRYHRLGLFDHAAETASREPPYVRLLFGGQYDLLLREIRKAGDAAWRQPGVFWAIGLPARARDWRLLEVLYDARPGSAEDLCHAPFSEQMNIDFALALSKRGRAEASSRLMECVQARLVQQSRGDIRSFYLSNGDLAFFNAQILSIRGNGDAALQALRRAVALGWVGWWPELVSYPAFDPIRSSPEFARIQASLNQRITKERRETLSQLPRAGR